MLWDVLNNLRSDYMLLTRRRFGLPTAVYFFSRYVGPSMSSLSTHEITNTKNPNSVVNLAYQLGTVIISSELPSRYQLSGKVAYLLLNSGACRKLHDYECCNQCIIPISYPFDVPFVVLPG